MDAQPAGVWRWRYFIAYGATLAGLLVPHMLDKMDGPTYSTAAVWLFSALAGGGAAAKVAKREARRGDAPARATDG